MDVRQWAFNGTRKTQIVTVPCEIGTLRVVVTLAQWFDQNHHENVKDRERPAATSQQRTRQHGTKHNARKLTVRKRKSTAQRDKQTTVCSGWVQRYTTASSQQTTARTTVRYTADGQHVATEAKSLGAGDPTGSKKHETSLVDYRADSAIHRQPTRPRQMLLTNLTNIRKKIKPGSTEAQCRRKRRNQRQGPAVRPRAEQGSHRQQKEAANRKSTEKVCDQTQLTRKRRVQTSLKPPDT